MTKKAFDKIREGLEEALAAVKAMPMPTYMDYLDLPADYFAPPAQPLHEGDCLDVMAGFAPETFDAVVTDPPYHLISIVKRFGKAALSDDTQTSARVRDRADGYARSARGFMGQTWDGGDIALRPETWKAVLDVLKPGAHMACFGGTRTFHRMACAIEDAGFEIRDCVMWVYGSGMPKSHNLKGLEWKGWGTAIKPAWEPIILARKPLGGTVAQNVATYGTGALNIDACRIAIDMAVDDSRLGGNGVWSTGKMAKNVYGEYAGDLVGSSALGRWPANLIHDGSDEVVSLFPAKAGAASPVRGTEASTPATNVYGEYGRVPGTFHADSGSAARFFYCSKATKAERAGSDHPTVKPIALLRYLCRLITPPGGLILDPFAGSGTTGQAAREEGFRATLIEREGKYVEDIKRRMG